jgi:hypothetical protein
MAAAILGVKKYNLHHWENSQNSQIPSQFQL